MLPNTIAWFFVEFAGETSKKVTISRAPDGSLIADDPRVTAAEREHGFVVRLSEDGRIADSVLYGDLAGYDFELVVVADAAALPS